MRPRIYQPRGSGGGGPIVWIQPTESGTAVYDINGVVIGYTYLGNLFSTIGGGGTYLTDIPFFIPIDISAVNITFDYNFGGGALRLASVKTNIECFDAEKQEEILKPVYILIDGSIFIR